MLGHRLRRWPNVWPTLAQLSRLPGSNLHYWPHGHANDK